MRARSGQAVQRRDESRAGLIPTVPTYGTGGLIHNELALTELAERTTARDPRVILGQDARLVMRVTSAIIGAVRAGAQSARLGDTSGLTYADGWASAATLAGLTAADAIAAELAELAAD